MTTEIMKESMEHFQLPGQVEEVTPFGNGHINDTYLLKLNGDDGKVRIILQRMNHEIFKNPVELMENVGNVTGFLQKKIAAAGGDPTRETLNVIPARDGKPYYQDSAGNYWRAYRFIEGASTYETIEKAEDFYTCAYAFGHFQRMLADYPAATLHETIKGFHDTAARYENFARAVAEDRVGRREQVREEIEFLMERRERAGQLGRMKAAGEMPVRVTHNDTKLNNIMIDDCTGQAICVIDLDTVMPGLAVHDFGDAIRTGASTGAEDEVDLAKVALDLALFEAFVKGFIAGCEGSLTATEVQMLPLGAWTITLEQAVRFLGDYLEGDVYYKIHREGHNLDRTRTQIKLVREMEAHWAELEQIVAGCR